LEQLKQTEEFQEGLEGDASKITEVVRNCP